MSARPIDRLVHPFRRRLATVLVCCVLLLGAAPVLADEYDPQEAAHPLRLIAYVLHPVGVVLDLLLVRPAHWLVSHDGIAQLVGHERYRD